MNILKSVLLAILLINGLQAGAFDARYPSARASAMGDGFVAVANDVWASYYNPAGLAAVDNYQVATAFQRPFNQSFFNNTFIGSALPVSQKYGTMGISFENYGVTYRGENLSSEMTSTFSHGFYLLNDMHSSLSAGYSLKYYHMDLGESVEGRKLGAAGTFGLDVGLQASLYERTYVGVYVYNINAPTLGEYTKHNLPQKVVIGAAYRPVTNLITTLSFDKTVGFDTQLQGGFEYLPASWLALRLGAGTDPNRFSAGMGLCFYGFQLDYSFVNHPVLPETHKFGLTYVFNK